ncbi:MAG: hypothetical protein V1906_03960 [Candidatus Woesearchaeota archaeon]
MSLELKLVSELSNPEKYRQYSEKGVFFMAHPGFYPYFHYKNSNRRLSLIEAIAKEGLADAQSNYSAMKNFVSVFQTLKEMTFFECLRSYGSLAVLLLPKDRMKTSFDGAGYDKYLELVSGNQDNFITMQSSRYNCGTFGYNDRKSLLKVFRAIGIHHVYLGGGYVNRCHKSSNEELVGMADIITLVPEASTVHQMPLTKRLLAYKLKSKALLNSAGQGNRKVIEAVYSHKDLCNEIIERTSHWLFKQAISELTINLKSIVPNDRLVHPCVRMFYERTGL